MTAETTPKKLFDTAVIAGDGIGTEIMPEGRKVFEAVGRKIGIEFAWDELL